MFRKAYKEMCESLYKVSKKQTLQGFILQGLCYKHYWISQFKKHTTDAKTIVFKSKQREKVLIIINNYTHIKPFCWPDQQTSRKEWQKHKWKEHNTVCHMKKKRKQALQRSQRIKLKWTGMKWIHYAAHVK